MESAIPTHLQCPRTRTRKIADDYAPPFPAWTARADASLERIVMGYFGVQSRSDETRSTARAALLQIADGFAGTDGPDHVDLAHDVDAEGYDTHIAIAYWRDREAFTRWQARPDVVASWESEQRLSGELGFFREILSPRVAHFETLFSAPDRLEGVGCLMGGRSEQPIQEHGYWGSMRERFPLSQTDGMEASGHLAADAAPGFGRRVRLSGHHHVALIRSGQDWTDTEGKERDLYLREMEPILNKGMTFLRDHGHEVGCYTNRYMRRLDAAGAPIEKSFGLSYWRSLGDMERWAESHPTHLAIFGTFMGIVGDLNAELALRLYHEVTVLKPDEQGYEYVNCHPRTGLMRACL
jgi:aldoxime dehydratase